ncbi:MAG: AAA15 family ATPase/GTPase, partial [Aureispira sp.]
MAREKHIVDLTIGNFKRFADFEVKNLGQFNLIVGDNNTGKTSFLEALAFDNEENIFEIIANLRTSVWVRSQVPTDLQAKDYLYDNLPLFLNLDNVSNALDISICKNNITYKMTLRKFNSDGDFETLNELEKQKLLNYDEVVKEFIFNINSIKTTTLSSIPILSDYYPFVAFGLGHDEHLIDYYSKYIDVNKTTRDQFIKRLQVLITKVNDVRVGNDGLNIYEEEKETPMPLFTYGEGANKLFRILCEIAMCRGKRLMIDEIDAGIHHSRF